MCVWYTVPTFLALLSISVAVPAPEDCAPLVKPLAPEDHPKIFGKWIFIEGVCNHDLFGSMLRRTSSSWVEMQPISHETVTLKQGNLIKETCLNSVVNMTFSNNTLQVTQMNVTSRCQFLQTCPHCLVMDIHSTAPMVATPIRSLYLFGRKGTLPDLELERFRKQAECLQFPQPAQFQYNGTAGFCAEKNETSPLISLDDLIALYELAL